MASGAPDRVAVAMSGGVDSSLAAALLVERGHRVLGVTMELGSWTPATVAVEDARRVAAHLGIPQHVVDLSREFRRQVVDPFVEEYLAGSTPNPCVRCNPCLKFGELLVRALALGATRMATGHYARVERDGATGRWQLLRAREPAKDQSYALAGLDQDQLARALFPLGELSKPDTRRLARERGLPVAARPESQDICFVPDGDYRAFLRRAAGGRICPGRFRDPQGRDLGPHRGLAFYTPGQRRRLGIQGEHRRHVVALLPEEDVVVVGTREQACSGRVRVDAVNWVSVPPPSGQLSCEVKLRYRGAAIPARVRPGEEGELVIHLERPELGVAPGQAAVLYDGERVLAAGTIRAG